MVTTRESRPNGIRKYFSLVFFAFALALQPASAGIETTLLGSPTPSWYTPKLHERVLAAGSEGLPVPPEASVSAFAFSGIRPGTWMVSPSWCTLNFIFNASGTMSGGPYYIGTARHCVTSPQPLGGSGGTESNPRGTPVVAAISTAPGSRPVLTTIGTVDFVTPRAEIGSDYALILLKPELHGLISPSMTGLGGPSSVFAASSTQTGAFSGHGLIVGTGGSTRPALVNSYNPAVAYGFGMVAGAAPGDSGSPVITASGAAVGNATHIGSSSSFPAANAFGTRVSLVKDLWGLSVVTCSSAAPWTGTGCPR